jgi:hypothetical protein
VAVTSGANPWGERGSYEAQEAFIKKFGYAVATRKAAEVDIVLPSDNPWGMRWSPLAQQAFIDKFGFERARLKAAEVGVYLTAPPPETDEDQLRRLEIQLKELNDNKPPPRISDAMQAAMYAARKRNRRAVLIADPSQRAAGWLSFGTNPVSGQWIALNGTRITFGTDVEISGTTLGTLVNLLLYLKASTDPNLVQATYALDKTTLYVTQTGRGTPDPDKDGTTFALATG